MGDKVRFILMYCISALLCGTLAVSAASPPAVKRIAHAGGGLNRETYTNSLEAFNNSYQRGFDLFEVDFEWTSDNQLVCIHDWSYNFKRFTGAEKVEKMSFASFTAARTSAKFHIMSLSELAGWMAEHPRASLVTDVKQDNIKALQVIARMIPDYSTRVIPQIYDPREYNAVVKIGYKNIIWTLYRFTECGDRVIQLARSMKLYAVTMPTGRAKQLLGLKLKALGIPTYVHTINSREQLAEYVRDYGISEIYTDFLPPE